MLVYGKNVAKELLQKKEKVSKIILQEGFDDKEIISLIKNGKFEVEYKQKREIDRLANGVHQGIILSIPDYKYKNMYEVLNKDPEFIVILDHLEDPHNFGAIIRTCEAAGVNAIVIPKDRQVQVNATVMKTSVGTIENMDIISVTNLVSTISELKEKGFWIVGTDMMGTNYDNIDYKGKTAIIIGNEGSGMSRIIKESSANSNTKYR